MGTVLKYFLKKNTINAININANNKNENEHDCEIKCEKSIGFLISNIYVYKGLWRN